MILLSLALCHSGFLAVCLSMPRHYRDIFKATASARRVLALKLAGWTGLAAGFAAAIRHSGWQVGPVLWVALLTIGALPVVLLLSYAPRRVVALAMILVPLSLFAVARG